MRSTGTLLCLASGAAFGGMAIFGKLAYDGGATVGTLLAVRFGLAAALLCAVAVATGRWRRLSRRDVAAGLALGACCYAAQAGCFFAALQRIDASLLSLLVYTFPAMVAVAAIGAGRERADRGRLTALALSCAGLVLVLAGAGTGALDPLGAALGLAAAAIYSVYVLASEGLARRVPASAFSALVCSGAAVPLLVGSALLGDLRPAEVTVAGWASLGGIAVVSTVAAICLFFAGLRRVGPTSASILSTVEPVVTVVLAFLVFGEVLGAVQILGGGFVVGAVVVLSARG
jgi:drug/metabolite transporter (DMT)-like permease